MRSISFLNSCFILDFNGGFNAGTQSTVPPTQPINGFSFNAPRIQANFTPMSIDRKFLLLS